VPKEALLDGLQDIIRFFQKGLFSCERQPVTNLLITYVRSTLNVS